MLPKLALGAAAAVFGILAGLSFLAFALETGILIGGTYYRDTSVLAGGIIFTLLVIFMLIALRDVIRDG